MVVVQGKPEENLKSFKNVTISKNACELLEVPKVHYEQALSSGSWCGRRGLLKSDPRLESSDAVRKGGSEGRPGQRGR